MMMGRTNLGRRKTTHIRVYKDDIEQIKNKFPDIKMSSFFHMAVKSNPFLQLEASLRRKKRK